MASRGHCLGHPQSGPVGSHVNTLRSLMEMSFHAISSLCLMRKDHTGQQDICTLASCYPSCDYKGSATAQQPGGQTGPLQPALWQAHKVMVYRRYLIMPTEQNKRPVLMQLEVKAESVGRGGAA